jgi:hypothetical protein
MIFYYFPHYYLQKHMNKDRKNPSQYGKDFSLAYFKIWIGFPKATSAASIVISPRVG